MLKKGDVILVVIIVFSILLGVLFKKDTNSGSVKSWNNIYSKNGSDLIAVIIRDNKIIKNINLANIKNREEFTIAGQFEETIAVEHNRIRFLKSTCPDEMCCRTGWLSKAGEIALCMPDRLMIKVQKQYSY